MRIKSTPDAPARPYVTGLALSTAVFLAILVLLWAASQIFNIWLGEPLLTAERFWDCAITLALVFFATLQAPLAACAVIAWSLDRKNKKRGKKGTSE